MDKKTGAHFVYKDVFKKVHTLKQIELCLDKYKSITNQVEELNDSKERGEGDDGEVYNIKKGHKREGSHPVVKF